MGLFKNVDRKHVKLTDLLILGKFKSFFLKIGDSTCKS